MDISYCVLDNKAIIIIILQTLAEIFNCKMVTFKTKGM